MIRNGMCTQILLFSSLLQSVEKYSNITSSKAVYYWLIYNTSKYMKKLANFVFKHTALFLNTFFGVLYVSGKLDAIKSQYLISIMISNVFQCKSSVKGVHVLWERSDQEI